MINLSSLDIANKNLVIRVDMNVPLKDSKVLDATRIKACLPTIQHALSNDARILLISHLGRPSEGKFKKKFSLQPVAEYIEQEIDLFERITALKTDRFSYHRGSAEVLKSEIRLIMEAMHQTQTEQMPEQSLIHGQEPTMTYE